MRIATLTITRTPMAAMFLATMFAGTATGQTEVEFEYSASSNTLALVDAELPELTGGCRITLAITGDQPPDIAAWQVALSGRPLTRVPDQLAFSGLLPDSATGELALSLTGTTTALAPNFPRFRARAGTGPCPATPLTGLAGGATTSARRKPLMVPERNEVNIYILEHGLAEKLPSGVTDNDIINVYLDLPASEPVAAYAIEIAGKVKGEEVNIVGTGDLPTFRKLAGLQGTAEVDRVIYLAGTYGPFSAPEFRITVTKQEGGKTVLQRTHSIRVRRTYIASLRAGVGLSSLRFNEFAAQVPAGGTEPVIQNVGPRGREVRPFLLVAFYSWRFWEPGFWNGRDLETDPGLLGRVNPTLGLGLDDIGDEYLVGLSLELARGLDVFYGRHYGKVRVLSAGFSEGAPFDGAAIPTATDWQHDDMFGASVDLRVATQILAGLFGGEGK